MTLFLTRDELTEMSGRKQRGKIADWMTGNGYKSEVAAVDATLMPTSGMRTMQRKEPDFSAYGQTTKAA